MDLASAFGALSQMPIPMFAKNDSFEYVWCNDAFLALVEKNSQDIIGKTAKDIFAESARPVEKSDARLTTGCVNDSYDLSYARQNGSVKKLLVHKHICEVQSEQFFIVGVMIDVTEKSTLELEYKTAIETTSDGFWIVEAKTGKILDVNDSYCKMVGRTKEETLSMSVREIEALESDSEMAATFKEIVEKKSHSFIATHRRKDGSLVKMEVNTKYSDMNGGIIFTFMKDITEKLKLQKRLADGEKIFKQFADNVKDVFWVKAPGKMLFINKAFETVWGVSREAIYKNPEIFVDKVIEEDREKVKNAFINELISDEHIFDEEYRIADETGKIKWIHARSYPIFDSKGAYVRNTGIARDISAQKQLEDVINKLNHELIKMVDSEMQKRLERELAFEGIFDISGNCLCIVDEQGVVEEVNKQFLSFFEFGTKEEVVGIFFGKLLSPVEYTRAENKLKQVTVDCTKHSCYCAHTAQSSKKTATQYEWRFKKKSGAEAVVLASVACFQKGDKQKRFIASIVDIARIRELEAREKERERLLAHQSKMAAMGEMIGAIAHQWRQPLNLLGILVQNIRYSFYDGELNRDNVEKYTTSAIEQINFMSKTIDDFRGFFKSDKEIVSFDVVAQVEKSVSMMIDMLKAHGVTTTIFVVKRPMARGYPNEVGQVMLNLLSNAKDALLDDRPRCCAPEIVVTVDSDEKYAIVKVQDNGGGIDDSIIDRIFEPYFTTKDEKKGTGIGLYMNKTIVEKNMHGLLGVQNNAGGALFIIKIPLANEHDIVF